MPLIPENIIDEVLSRIDIVELISSYIPVKRAGRNYKALCPFHHEKTPSFVISPDRQIFHCFGCSVGGNALGFLMQYERFEFPEAIEILAKKAGVVLPKTASNQQEGLNSQIYRINELAAKFYSGELHSKEGEAALSYLTQRGITEETIQKFNLGYAPNKTNSLFNYLRAKNFPIALIEKAGLIIPKDGGGYYDRFRGRSIIPIVDTRSRIIAFGGRVLDKSLPKYLNSPETAVYSKGKTLFGLNVSSEPIRVNDAAIIVEGYFDLIVPYQAGIKNIVASCGTALTAEQIRLLKRYSGNVIMIYDSDNAGQTATLRGLELLIEEGLFVRIGRLPEGYDPDSYLRSFGIAKFQELLKEAKDIFDYKLEFLKTTHNPENITNKAKIVSEMLPTINKFSNMVLKSAYLRKLSEELKLDEDSLLLELKKIKDSRALPKPSTDFKIQNQLKTNTNASERLLVKLMLEEEELIDYLRGKISPDDFQDSHLSQIVSKVFGLFCDGQKNRNLNRLINHFADTAIPKIICELTASEGIAAPDRKRMADDCVRRLKDDGRKLKQKEICEELKLAEGKRDENRIKELLCELQSTVKKRN